MRSRANAKKGLLKMHRKVLRTPQPPPTSNSMRSRANAKKGLLKMHRRLVRNPPHTPLLSHPQKFLLCKVYKGYRIPTLFLT